jgi:hypothetical protein
LSLWDQILCASVLGTCREGRNPWPFFWSHKKQTEGLYLSHMLHVWYIYLHLGDFARANVGKYTSTMEHMGMVSCQQESLLRSTAGFNNIYLKGAAMLRELILDEN